MRRLVIFFGAILLMGSVNGRRKMWTEDDEAKYLQSLKERELKEFEIEMNEQSRSRKTKYGMDMTQLGSQNRLSDMELPSELRPLNIEKRKKPVVSDAPRHEALVSADSPEISDKYDEDGYWCYHCASPIDKIRSDVRKSIKNLLEMRRTTFPTDVVTSECLTARNLTKLKKVKCSYNYCQSLSILDRNAGSAFVVRGCAEHFGAMNLPEMEKKPDHSCAMLHEKLEIKECICKTARYCKAGWNKRNSNGVENKATVLSTILLVAVTIFVL